MNFLHPTIKGHGGVKTSRSCNEKLAKAERLVLAGRFDEAIKILRIAVRDTRRWLRASPPSPSNPVPQAEYDLNAFHNGLLAAEGHEADARKAKTSS